MRAKSKNRLFRKFAFMILFHDKRAKNSYQISWYSVWRDDVDSSADGAVAPVGSKDDNGSNSGLQSTMQVCEALRKRLRNFKRHFTMEMKLLLLGIRETRIKTSHLPFLYNDLSH